MRRGASKRRALLTSRQMAFFAEYAVNSKGRPSKKKKSMPELPEVETIKRQFERALVGRKITSVEIGLQKIVRGRADAFARAVSGAHFTGARRRAKLLMLDLSNGYTILVHLKVSGQLLYAPASAEADKHTHAMFHLDNGMDLRLRDVRQFGYLKLVRREDVAATPELRDLGPEALDMSLEQFRMAIAKRRNAKIKAALIDQRLIAGIGNIYSDEALFCARIHPERRVGSLDPDEEARIYRCIRELLNSSIMRRGTSVALYVDLFGNKGENQNYLRVYGRKGKPCEICAGKIERIKVAGRSAHFCPSCQR